MNRNATILSLLVLVGVTTAGSAAATLNRDTPQSSIRIAFIGFTPSKAANDSPLIASALAEALSRHPRITLLDPSLVQSALAGIRYDGSINMTNDEARRLAAAIGCDFFIVGKAETFTRSERANESHEQAYAGVMIVDGQTGALISFDFISNKSSTKEAAEQSLVKALESRITGYVDRMIQPRARSSTPRSRDSANSALPGSDAIEEIPPEDSPRASGFKPPEFLNRVKPEYTAEAELADITATVEAMVVFASSGEIGRIEITRWAGFGLDESAERAIHQLKFKPATRNGNPINVLAMIRYNFRRVPAAVNKAEPQVVEPPTKPKSDLREIFKPTFRRPGF